MEMIRASGLANFAPDQVTRVDVCFDPAEDGTRVSITHSGWDTIPPTHPEPSGPHWSLTRE